jgi:hypothetical protein
MTCVRAITWAPNDGLQLGRGDYHSIRPILAGALCQAGGRRSPAMYGYAFVIATARNW